MNTFSGVSFYVSPDSQKLYDPQVVTVLGFKLFHEIPTCSLWHKFYDVEPHKRQDWNFIWFHLLKIICGLQLLRNLACFQINRKPPCSFHPPSEISRVSLRGTGKASLTPDLLWWHLCSHLCFVYMKWLPAVPIEAALAAVNISLGPFGGGGGNSSAEHWWCLYSSHFMV